MALIQGQLVKLFIAALFATISARPNSAWAVAVSSDSKTRLAKYFRRNTFHICSAGFNSGEYGGSLISALFSGITRSLLLWDDAPSTTMTINSPFSAFPLGRREAFIPSTIRLASSLSCAEWQQTNFWLKKSSPSAIRLLVILPISFSFFPAVAISYMPFSETH